MLNAEYQRRWLDSVQLEDPNKPDGQRYGYGIAQMHWGPNTFYFHGGETPATIRSSATTRTNQVTLVVWTNLTVSLDDSPTANALMLKSARSDLRGVAGAASPVADHPLARVRRDSA